MSVRVDASEVSEFARELRSVRWEQPLQDAFDEAGRKVEDKARSKAGSVGGAAGLTAATLQVDTAFDQMEVSASTPFARGSEFGSSGANPSTRQFSNRPGGNREDGYWLGPALDDQEDDLVQVFDDMVDEAVDHVFSG